MKIKKFNESLEYNSDEYLKPKDMSKKEFDYIIDFSSNCDYNIIECVSSTSILTKLKYFRKLTNSKKSALELSETMNLKKLKELFNIEDRIKELDKEYANIIKEKNKLSTDASNEILYTYQEELLNKDFDSFFELFIKDLYEEYINGNADNDYIYYDIHPKIMIEYGEKIIEHVDTLINTKKYNL